jgi:hypothetical protein
VRLARLLEEFAEARNPGAALIETGLAVRANTRLRPTGFFSAETWRTTDLEVEIISPFESATTIHLKFDACLK